MFYADCGYEGKSIKLCKDTADFTQIGFNDSISSVAVSPGTVIHLFTDANYGGLSYKFLTNMPIPNSCFLLSPSTAAFNDQASSVKFSTSTYEIPELVVFGYGEIVISKEQD